MIKLRSLNLLTILKFGMAALLLVIPLYPKFPIFNVPGIYVAVRAEDFLILFLCLVWSVYLIRGNKIAFLAKNKVVQAIVLFWLAGALSGLSAIFITQTVSPSIVALHWARRVEYMLPVLIAYTVVFEIKRSRYFIQNLFVGAFFVFLFGFGQIHFGFPVITTQNEEYSKGLALRWISGARLGSTFAGHYDLAAFLVMLLPLGASLFFYYKKVKNKILFFFFSILPGFWLMLRAESRVSFLSFLFGISVSLWLLRKRLFIIPVIVLCALSAIFFSNLGMRYRLGIKTYWQRLVVKPEASLFIQTVQAQEISPAPQRERSKETKDVSPSSPSILEDRSAAIRLNIEWPRAIRAFEKNPLLGTGYSSITLATDNDFLRALGEVGLIGAFSFVLVLVRVSEEILVYLKTAKKGWEYAYIVGFVGAMSGILLNATFIDVFEASKVAIIFWALCGIALGMIERKKHT